MVKIALKSINNYKYRKLFPSTSMMKHHHYREIEKIKKDFIYKNTQNITFFYKNDLSIIEKFSKDFK